MSILATTFESKARFAWICPTVSKSCILVSMPWTICRKIAGSRASCDATSCWRRAPGPTLRHLHRCTRLQRFVERYGVLEEMTVEKEYGVENRGQTTPVVQCPIERTGCPGGLCPRSSVCSPVCVTLYCNSGPRETHDGAVGWFTVSLSHCPGVYPPAAAGGWAAASQVGRFSITASSLPPLFG